MRRWLTLGLGRKKARLVLLLLAIAVAVYRYWIPRPPDSSTRGSDETVTATVPCIGEPGCFMGTVTKVADGDTLDVSGIRVRLVLVDAPEANTREGPDSSAYLARLCPLGTKARVIEDRMQPTDDYGRTLAAVWCEGRELLGPVNAEMIRSGHAQLYRRFCRESAFGMEPWAAEVGCLE
jgi:endonuclease YncB( thermonuclease family)